MISATTTMISKVIFYVFASSLVLQALAEDRALCPNPDTANHMVLKEELHLPAPSFGRTSKDILIPKMQKPITCITLTEYGNALSGSISIASIGTTPEGTVVRMVSSIKHGVDVEIVAYTE
ncbi:hypothetical protein NQ315_015421 [Exocentrus adspersus]|uniref:Uncharacterized protein n=1 Tax=Exocentrus adspersus TaxID=1586481 RepID=A0AAV8VLP4_9CUCU|nr:hypothetical protein NQ315_015421 [Exocentrus adspersus]